MKTNKNILKHNGNQRKLWKSMKIYENTIETKETIKKYDNV